MSLSENTIDTVKVLGANMGASIITIANVNQYLTTISLIAAITYTAWKWNKDYYKRKKEEENDG